MTATTPTTDRLRARLAYLREEEHRRYQDVYASKPYSSEHVAAQGRWGRTLGAIEEVERMMREENE